MKQWWPSSLRPLLSYPASIHPVTSRSHPSLQRLFRAGLWALHTLCSSVPELAEVFHLRSPYFLSLILLSFLRVEMAPTKGGQQQPQWQQRSDGYWELVPGDGTRYYQGADGEMYQVPQIIDLSGGLQQANRDRLLQYLISHTFHDSQGNVVQVTRATVTYPNQTCLNSNVIVVVS